MSGDRAAAKRALAGAIAFLLRARWAGAACVWRDFIAFGVESDEWVSAYAACALAESGDCGAIEAAHRAWTWLAEESLQHGPGLGYCTRTPQDADSTIWGYRLAAAIGRDKDEFAFRSLDFLGTCVHADGGIATFSSGVLSPLFKYIGSTEDAIGGWTASHACVTATAAWLPGIAESADVYGFLTRTQDPRGFWSAYWWADPEYATAHALESLARAGERGELLDRAVAWMANSPVGRSAFTLALRLIGVAKAGRHDFEPALEELLALQLADGSWPASARLRIPPPALKDPRIQWNWDETSNGIGSVFVDQRRIFTTATALRALSACLMR